MAKSLSNMFRYNIKEKDEVTIAEEMEQIKQYINIQLIRFHGKFQVHYEIDEDVYQCTILKFLLQPIVENAISDGLEPKFNKGYLSVSIQQMAGIIMINIEDDGVGIPEPGLKRLKQSMAQGSGCAAI
jgi:two-component system sensor histidine kinase YesM